MYGFVGQWRQELLASIARNSRLAPAARCKIDSFRRVSCEYSGQAGGRVHLAPGRPFSCRAPRYEGTFCLRFATLTVFLDKTCGFDFPLAKTRLSLRGTGADWQSF
jgi:hypothetical protein